MPIIYLSPSTQENNMYVTGTGSEEYHMNRLADAMIPYLNSCGIRYVRNTPEMSAGSSIRQANQGWYNFYLALHSNAAAEENYGSVRGIIAFYYPRSTQGQRAAQIFVNNLREIYPEPDLLRLTDFFGIPFIWPTNPWEAAVHAGGGTLNLRDRPSRTAAVVASIPDGTQVRIYGQYEGWYVVRYGDYMGYAASQFIY